MKNNKKLPSEIVLYQSEDGKYQIALARDSGSIWLNTNEIAELYQTSKQNVSYHILNILEEGELKDLSTVKDYLTVQSEQERQVHRNIRYYSLEMILAVGYRVRSERGTQFRIWATQHLSEYLQKGFVLDAERLKGNDRITDYFDELLAQIREIRTSEKRAYLRVREIFSLAADYNPSSSTAKHFFANMQNKMIYAATEHTAAELILMRADANMPNMGTTSWKGSKVRKADVSTSKNYLQAKEIDILNRIVNIFLEQAELKCLRKQELLTSDWELYLDKFLLDNELPKLNTLGKVSHEQAKNHAEAEYQIYDAKRKEEIEQEAEKRYIEDLQNSVKNVAARRRKK